MNSIDRNQPESSHEDLQGTDAVARIRHIVEKAETCFFCSAVAFGETGGARPMSVQKADDDGTLWFLSVVDSLKDREVAEDPRVTLYFQASAHAGFLVLEGTASLSRDRARIDELWKPTLRTWFTDGKDDPRISVIRFTPQSGYYWDVKHGNAVAGIKMLLGAALRTTLDDSIQGTVRPRGGASRGSLHS